MGFRYSKPLVEDRLVATIISFGTILNLHKES